jgi:hypothetical protein
MAPLFVLEAEAADILMSWLGRSGSKTSYGVRKTK